MRWRKAVGERDKPGTTGRRQTKPPKRERESQRVERGGVAGGFGERGSSASERERVEESRARNEDSQRLPQLSQINLLFFFLMS